MIQVIGRTLIMWLSCMVGIILFLTIPIGMILQWGELHNNLCYLLTLGITLVFMFYVLKGGLS